MNTLNWLSAFFSPAFNCIAMFLNYKVERDFLPALALKNFLDR